MRTTVELGIVDPLAAQKIAQHRDMGGDGPPMQRTVDVGEVEVVAEQVDPLRIDSSVLNVSSMKMSMNSWIALRIRCRRETCFDWNVRSFSKPRR